MTNTINTEDHAEYTATPRAGADPDDIRALSDTDLVSTLLRITPQDALSRIQDAGSLRALAEGNTALQTALEFSRRHLRESLNRGQPLTSPQATREYLRAALRDRRNEVFCAMMLDTRHRVIAFDELFTGTIDSAHVHPRVVVEKALTRRASSMIVCHNHPSGVAEPSQADLAITRRLRDALGLVDIRLLDHFIVSDADVVSLAERGLV